MENDSTGNRTLARIASILDTVEATGTSASELARRTGLSVSTTHRLAAAMAEYGFLRRSARGYKLGYRFARTRLEQAALPVLTRLRDSTGETAQLWIRDKDERVCVVSVDTLYELKATVPVGTRLPLPAGSSGRLLDHDIEAWDSIENEGWVESSGRRTPGLGSVSAPVVLSDTVAAAVCLAIPLARVMISPGRDHGDGVVDAAEEISRAVS